MRTFGQILFSIGILLIVGGFFVPVSTHVGYMPSNPFLPSLPSDVVNLQGLHVQALVFQGGFTGLIVGALLEGFGLINETLNKNAGNVVETPPAEPDEERGASIWLLLGGLALAAIITLVILAGQTSSSAPVATTNDAKAMSDAMNDMANSSEAAARAENAAEAAMREATKGGR